MSLLILAVGLTTSAQGLGPLHIYQISAGSKSTQAGALVNYASVTVIARQDLPPNPNVLAYLLWRAAEMVRWPAVFLTLDQPGAALVAWRDRRGAVFIGPDDGRFTLCQQVFGTSQAVTLNTPQNEKHLMGAGLYEERYRILAIAGSLAGGAELSTLGSPVQLKQLDLPMLGFEHGLLQGIALGSNLVSAGSSDLQVLTSFTPDELNTWQTGSEKLVVYAGHRVFTVARADCKASLEGEITLPFPESERGSISSGSAIYLLPAPVPDDPRHTQSALYAQSPWGHATIVPCTETVHVLWPPIDYWTSDLATWSTAPISFAEVSGQNPQIDSVAQLDNGAAGFCINEATDGSTSIQTMRSADFKTWRPGPVTAAIKPNPQWRQWAGTMPGKIVSVLAAPGGRLLYTVAFGPASGAPSGRLSKIPTIMALAAGNDYARWQEIGVVAEFRQAPRLCGLTEHQGQQFLFVQTPEGCQLFGAEVIQGPWTPTPAVFPPEVQAVRVFRWKDGWWAAGMWTAGVQFWPVLWDQELPDLLSAWPGRMEAGKR